MAETDRHVWLEDVLGEKSLQWVNNQNKISGAALESLPFFAATQNRLKAIYDADDRTPQVTKRGAWLYNFWRDAKNPRGLWRRTSLDSFKTPSPDWETVLDLDALASTENENWVWVSAQTRHPNHDRALLELSRGGADAGVLREFDLNTKSFVADGFQLAESKMTVGWAGEDAIFVATDFGPGSMTNSGYSRIVKRWRRGQPLQEATTIFEASTTDVWAYAYEQLEPDGTRHEFVVRGLDFFHSEVFVVLDGVLRRIEKPNDAEVGAFNQWLLVRLRSDWHLGDQNFKQGSLLSVPVLDAVQTPGTLPQVVFEPDEESALQDFCSTQNRLVLNVLHRVKTQLLSAQPNHKSADQHWTLTPLLLPEHLTVQARPFDNHNSDDLLLESRGYLTPSTLALYAGAYEPLKQNPIVFDATGLCVQQLEAISKDGTRIPYFLVAASDIAHDGRNPTVLHGYGGFEVSAVPEYLQSNGPAWLAQGGVYVEANIRGGGEFGPRWHQAALRENRQRAYDDFIAVAEDLIAKGITSPQRLGIEGGSNGGLLVGAVMTQRPELFAAVVCRVPLLDMQRYHKLLAGASWMSEYGDPDNPNDWDFLRRYSPYHNVFAGREYPKVLFTTSTRDDRVHPGHARKMVAKMLEQGHRVLYCENVEGGHAAAADNAQAARMRALEFAFLRDALM